MSISAWILSASLMFQGGAPTDRQLFSQILAETRPAAKLRLGDELAKKYPESDLRDDAYLIAMGIYQTQGDAAKMVDYGERAIKVNPDALEALVTLSRQYAVEGRNLNRAFQYARRAIEVADKSRGNPPPGYDADVWAQYVLQSKETAEGTIKYIQEFANAILGRKKGPGGK